MRNIRVAIFDGACCSFGSSAFYQKVLTLLGASLYGWLQDFSMVPFIESKKSGNPRDFKELWSSPNTRRCVLLIGTINLGMRGWIVCVDLLKIVFSLFCSAFRVYVSIHVGFQVSELLRNNQGDMMPTSYNFGYLLLSSAVLSILHGGGVCGFVSRIHQFEEIRVWVCWAGLWGPKQKQSET